MTFGIFKRFLKQNKGKSLKNFGKSKSDLRELSQTWSCELFPSFDHCQFRIILDIYSTLMN